MKTQTIITALFILAGMSSFSQEQSAGEQADRSQALNIYLDCGSCDMEYFKTNLTAVNYVNDNLDADVHVMVSSLPTGSGGREYNIRLIGQGSYKFLMDTVVAVMPEYYTDDETRMALLDKISLGLVPYLLKTPYGEKLTLFIDDTSLPAEENDPWRNWVFSVSGSGSVDLQKYYKAYSLNGSVYISKITPDIKIESYNIFGFNESKFEFDDEESSETYSISQQDLTSQNLFVKSIGKHWGLGGFASFGKSEYSNLDFQLTLGPAAEYNIFDYDEASTRECRILYSVNFEHSKYNTMTIYDRMYDDLFKQDLSINFSYYEKWGTLSATAFASSYINDLSQYNAGVTATAYLKLFKVKGLSLDFIGGISYSQNQRTLTLEKGSYDKYITGQMEMEHGLSYSIHIGISYRFGSKYNNSVNARFGY